MEEIIRNYVNLVKARHEKVKGNEQATKQSLIAPLFTHLGYDLADPQECVPEFKEDFGKTRGKEPVDWAFFQNGQLIFLVEAKDAGTKLAGFDEQLADYFAKRPEAKLKVGILTNGVLWRFFTDLNHDNVMDKEPFVTWDVLNDDQPPFDFLKLLQKSQFKRELVRTFAQQQHDLNFLVNELDKLLEPSDEFTRLAIANIEKKRPLTPDVVERRKSLVVRAIGEWAKLRRLADVLNPSPVRETVAHEKAKEGQQDLLVTQNPPPERHGLRKRFWQGLISRAKTKNTRHGNIAPSEYSWIAAGSGVRGCPFTYAIGQDESRVELFMDRGAGRAEENKRMFDWLLKHKSEIEQAFGGELSWLRLDDKQACRIAHTLNVGGYRSDEAKWLGIQHAMIEAMTRLENALAPHLPKLNAEFAS